MTFMDLMNKELGDYLNSLVIVFIGVIFVYYKSEDEHAGHLRLVLQVLTEHKLCAKYSKCEFWLRSRSFLSHIVSCASMEVDPNKM